MSTHHGPYVHVSVHASSVGVYQLLQALTGSVASVLCSHKGLLFCVRCADVLSTAAECYKCEFCVCSCIVKLKPRTLADEDLSLFYNTLTYLRTPPDIRGSVSRFRT